MKLIQETQPDIMTMRNKKMSTNPSVKDVLPDSFDVKEKKSSDASLLVMNPVASGDNVTTGFNSCHKLKEELPPLVPVCEGRELQIDEDLVRCGLSAISVKHDNIVHCWSMSRACEKLQVPAGPIKHRNSFRCLHRPDLKRVTYLRRMTPDELETLFRGYADVTSRPIKNENGEDITEITQPPSENSARRKLQKEISSQEDNGNGGVILHPIPETRSGSEDVPAGMRLHGTRARLYTSVLASAKGGDQLDKLQFPEVRMIVSQTDIEKALLSYSGELINEEYDASVPDDVLPEDEVPLNEELQIILPPRCDDVTPDSSITTTSTDS